jgi:hypothetical protein
MTSFGTRTPTPRSSSLFLMSPVKLERLRLVVNAGRLNLDSDENSIWRMSSCDMWRHVRSIQTDTSEENVTRILTFFRLPWRLRRHVTPKRRFTLNTPEDGIFRCQRRENLKSYKSLLIHCMMLFAIDSFTAVRKWEGNIETELC